jgi:putative mRNA 3-end processing factor
MAPVTWRDGVHLTGTPIWCDARRRRDVCFLSSADRVGRTGHGQLIGTPLTLALLGARDKGHLAVPLRQRFTLGTVRLELIPSGRGFGAAALYADVTGKTVLYAGAVRTSAGGVGDPAELRTCDAVVVAAPHGELADRFPPLRAAIDAALEWTRAQLAAGARPVLFVDSLLDGLEVASRVAAEGVGIAGSRALRDAAQRIADLVPSPQIIDGAIAIGSTITQRSMTPDPGSGVPAIAAPGREPRATVWLDSDRAGLARSLGDRPVATALVSARARHGAAGYDAGFVWAAAADRAQLLGWIEATGARDVYVTGACAEAIVGALGDRARVIGPPHQMALFPHEAAT